MNDGKRASREVVHEALGLLRLFDLKAASEPQAAGEMVARCIRIAQAEPGEATVGDVLRVMTEQPEPMAAELRGRAIANLERVSKRGEPGEPGEQVDGGIFLPHYPFRRWTCTSCGAMSFSPCYLGAPNFCQHCGAPRAGDVGNTLP